MLDARAREALEGVSRVIGRSLAATHVTPNAVTVAGCAIIGVAAWQVIAGDLPLAGWICAVGGCFDFLDGSVARATGKTTRFGAILDSVTDRISDGLILGAIAWVLLRDGDPLPAALAIVALVAGNLVSYIRAKAESLGYDCKVGFLERAERIFVICAGLILGFLTIALWVIAVASAFTAAQRLVHVWKQAREAA